MTDDEKIDLLTTAATHREMAPPTWTIADGHRCLADDCCTREERIAERERVRKRAASATAPIDVVVQTRSVAAPGCIESLRERPLNERDQTALVRWLVDACEVALHNCEVLLRGGDIVGQPHRTPERDQQLVGIARDELARLGVAEHVNVVLVFDEVGLTGLKAQARDERLRDDVRAEAERRDEEMEAPVAVQLLRDLRSHLIYAAVRSSQCAELIDRLTLELARAGALT